MNHQERNSVRTAYIHKAEHLGAQAGATMVGELSVCESGRGGKSVCFCEN